MTFFDSKCHIKIETNAPGYAIVEVLNQLILDFSQWHLVAYFSKKMISAKTRYEIYNGELLAILKAFKTWLYYLEGCKHKVLSLLTIITSVSYGYKKPKLLLGSIGTKTFLILFSD